MECLGREISNIAAVLFVLLAMNSLAEPCFIYFGQFRPGNEKIFVYVVEK